MIFRGWTLSLAAFGQERITAAALYAILLSSFGRTFAVVEIAIECWPFFDTESDLFFTSIVTMSGVKFVQFFSVIS